MLGKDAPAQMEEEDDERGGQKEQERDDCVPLAGVPIPRLDAEEEAQEEARAEMTSSEAAALLDVDAEAIAEAAGEDALAIVSAGGFHAHGTDEPNEFDAAVNVPQVDNTIVAIGRATLRPAANIIAFNDLGELKFALDAGDDLNRALQSEVDEHKEAIKNARVLTRIGSEMGDEQDLSAFNRDATRNVRLGLICYSVQVEPPGAGDMSVTIPIALQEEAAEAHRHYKQQKARRVFYANKYT